MAVVVLEVATQCASERVVGLEGRSVQELRLERVEERLHVCVLAGAVERGALLYAQLPQAIAEDRPGVLAPAITVEDESRPHAATPHCGIQDGAREVGAATAGERPREDATRVAVHHDGEKAPAARDGDERGIADPHPVGPPHGQSSDAIGMLTEELMQLRVRVVDPGGAGAEGRRDASDASRAGG